MPAKRQEVSPPEPADVLLSMLCSLMDAGAYGPEFKTPPGATTTAGGRKPNRRRIPLNVRVEPAVARQLRQAATRRRRRLQDEVGSALQTHLRRIGLWPVADAEPLPLFTPAARRRSPRRT